MKPDKEEAGELTLDELEKVIGGQSYERYEQYRIEIINEYQGQKIKHWKIELKNKDEEIVIQAGG